MAIDNIEGLEPHSVWLYFSQICDVPRTSKSEEQIIAYLKSFAQEHALECISDSVGNIVIIKEATKGRENSPIITLQAHMDMVAEKEPTLDFDFLLDPISAYVEDGWIKARGTTLGADCGIGMAVMLALLDSNEISHPKIEALFTVDEESGLTGAFALSEQLLKGKYLINVDSEDKGEIFVGCAGGIDTIASFDIERVTSNYDSAIKISVSGLMGGHSGDDIDKCRANANILLCRVLYAIKQEIKCDLVEIGGGNLRNAIARDAEAIVALGAADRERAISIASKSEADFKIEYTPADANIVIGAMAVEPQESYIDSSISEAIICSVLSSIDGITAMSQQMAGFVESSTNLASIKERDGAIVISTSQRSSLESKKMLMAKQISLHFLRFGAKVRHSDGYPGWNPQLDSRLLDIAIKSHNSALGYEPKVRAIHAGLECGLIKKKYPKMEMISIGPTITGAHSPSERLSIADTQEFWIYLIEILKNL